MFHRVRSDKPQDNVQDNAVKAQVQPKAPEVQKPSFYPAAENDKIEAEEPKQSKQEKDVQAPIFAKTNANNTDNQNTDSQQKEDKMNDQTNASQNDQAEDKSTLGGKPMDIASPYGGQQSSVQRGASPYGGGAYPGFAGGSPAAKGAEVGSDRRLVIGPGITMSGEIESCDHLLVEGTIEAALKGAKVLEVSETGTFYGTVEIKNATIAGRFEGDLTVDGRLVLKAGGVITGSISYRELQIEAGAIIDGKLTPLRSQVQVEDKPAAKGKASIPSAPKASKADAQSPANTDGQLFAEAGAAE